MNKGHACFQFLKCSVAYIPYFYHTCESHKWSSTALWLNDQCTKFNFWGMGSIPDPIGVTHDAAPDQNWRSFCSGRRSLMWSDDVLCFICVPVAQRWSVTMYWLLKTDFVDIVRWSCSSSAIMPPFISTTTATTTTTDLDFIWVNAFRGPIFKKS